MGGFAGYHTATTKALPDAVPVMDPFHVVQLARRKLTQAVVNLLRRDLPAGLDELAQLGRTLWRKRAHVLAFFDRGGASNGSVEAINGRFEHLRGIGLGFRNFGH